MFRKYVQIMRGDFIKEFQAGRRVQEVHDAGKGLLTRRR